MLNVNAIFALIFLSSVCVATTPILNNLNLLRQLDKKRKLKAQAPAPAPQAKKFDDASFMSEYKKHQRRNLQDAEPAESVSYDPKDSFIDLNFEAREVTEAINFIEFKMNEINSLIQECVDNRFATSLMADVQSVRQECAGASYQILIFNYQESIRKIKEILLELIKIKLEHVQTDHDEEVNFFLDVLEQLIDADFSLPESLQIVKQSSQYYVSPRFFDKIIELSKTELQAFHEVHKRLRDARADLQKSLESHASDEEGYVELLEDRGSTYDLAFTPKLPVIDRKMRGQNQGLQDLKNYKKVTQIVQNEKLKEMAQNKIQQFFKSREGQELMEGVMAGIASEQTHDARDYRPRELLDAEPNPEQTLERNGEMGWEPIDTKQGGKKGDIMGWDGKRLA